MISTATIPVVAYLFYDIAIKPVIGEIWVEYAKGLGLFDFTSASLKIVWEQVLSSSWAICAGLFLLTITAFAAGAWVNSLSANGAALKVKAPSEWEGGTDDLNIGVRVALANYPLEKVADLRNVVQSERDDHDIMPHRLIIRGKMDDDGYDIWPVIEYRNRSTRSLMLKAIDAHYDLDGRTPYGGVSRGVNADIKAGQTDSISFKPVRIYTDRPVSGHVLFAFRYGDRNSALRTILHMSYEFDLRSFPPNKHTDAALSFRVVKDERYFVGEPSR